MYFSKTILGLISGRASTGRVPILTYHRVFKEKDSLIPWDLDEAEFRRQMKFVSTVCEPMTVSSAAALLQRRELPRRAVCVTFDDGYADNHDVAMPVLRDLGIPATFYVATGYLNGGVMWNDKVIVAVRNISLGSHTVAPLPQFELASEDDRGQLAYELVLSIRYLPQDERNGIADALLEYSGADQSATSSIMMTDEKIRNLANNRMEVGAHTVSHPILAKLEDDQAELEINASKKYLEQITQSDVQSFAFPNGRFGLDLTERDIKLVEAAGFRSAVTTDWGVATGRSNVLALPRLGLYGNNDAKLLFRLMRAYTTQDKHQPAKRRLMQDR